MLIFQGVIDGCWPIASFQIEQKKHVLHQYEAESHETESQDCR